MKFRWCVLDLAHLVASLLALYMLCLTEVQMPCQTITFALVFPHSKSLNVSLKILGGNLNVLATFQVSRVVLYSHL